MQANSGGRQRRLPTSATPGLASAGCDGLPLAPRPTPSSTNNAETGQSTHFTLACDSWPACDGAMQRRPASPTHRGLLLRAPCLARPRQRPEGHTRSWSAVIVSNSIYPEVYIVQVAFFLNNLAAGVYAADAGGILYDPGGPGFGAEVGPISCRFPILHAGQHPAICEEVPREEAGGLARRQHWPR